LGEITTDGHAKNKFGKLIGTLDLKKWTLTDMAIGKVIGKIDEAGNIADENEKNLWSF